MKTISNVWMFALLAAMCFGTGACTKTKPTPKPEVTVDIPVGLVSTVNKTTGNVRLDWTRNSLATNYEVEIIGAGLFYDTGKANTYTVLIKDLDYNTSYEWRVRTYVDDAVSDWAQSSFKTGAEPNTGGYVGLWEAGPDDVDVTINAFGYTTTLSEMELDGYEQPTENLELTISKVTGEDNKVLLTIENLESYMPTAKIEDVELIVKPDNTLHGSRGETEEIPFNLKDPVPINEIPGVSDLLGGLTINANVTSISIKINSVNVSGNLTNTEQTEAQFTVVTSAFMGIKTDNSDLNLIIDAALANQSVSIKAIIDCKKKAE